MTQGSPIGDSSLECSQMSTTSGDVQEGWKRQNYHSVQNIQYCLIKDTTSLPWLFMKLIGEWNTTEWLTELRARYWIIRGRNFVRKSLSRCVICKWFERRVFAPPPAPPLPSLRVDKAYAFSYTGVDFAGPLHVKSSGSTASEGEKVCICLYTCCVVRAIHLEIVQDMTAQAFLRCFKQFTARRGFPIKVLSDNRLTFKVVDRMLSSILNHPTVKVHFKGMKVQLDFDLEKAPWWGGKFERVVRSVKTCLRKTIGRGRLTFDELHTAFTEVDMLVNLRPLSFISTENTEVPITPSHLIVGIRLMSLPDGPYNEDLEDDCGTLYIDQASDSPQQDSATFLETLEGRVLVRAEEFSQTATW